MKTIILLHGAIGASDQVDPLGKELTQQGFQVFSFNFSGHGNMPFQKDFGIEQFALELEEFIKTNNYNSFFNRVLKKIEEFIVEKKKKDMYIRKS